MRLNPLPIVAVSVWLLVSACLAAGANLHVSYISVVVQGEPTGTTVRPIVLTNVGSDPLSLTDISIIQPGPRPYGHQFIVGGTCVGGIVLAPQASCRVDVGLLSSGFEIPSNFSDATLLISTNVDAAPIVVNLIGQVCDLMDCDSLTRFLADHLQPKWLEFPPQPVGESAGPLALKTFDYVGHIGNNFIAMLSGGDTDSFQITSTSCRGVEQPDCVFEIMFTPRNEGPLATELVIYGPSSSRPAWFSIFGYGGSLSTEPPPPASSAIGPGFTGHWFDPAQGGHGLMIEVLPDGRLLAAWLAFNPAGTGQAWIVGVGTYSGNTATVAEVQQPTGGRWIPNFDANQIVHNNWGTLTFTFTDCNHGMVDFNSTRGYGAGSMNLTRLTQPAGLSCP